MESRPVFGYSEYKDFLKDRLQQSWGEVSRAAEAAGCQRSYLSRVINGPQHLTPDHAYGLCEFWELSSSETEYFLALVEHARAATARFRKRIELKLAELRRAHEDLANRVQRSRVEPGEKELAYYSAWYWSAIHIAVSIPELQTPKAIATRLQIPESLVITVLEALAGYGLVRRDASRWIYGSMELHVPRQSLMVGLHHANWRQRAILDAQMPESRGVHFTVIQSMSHTAHERIKERMLDLIDEAGRIAGPSKEEELVCFACDLFGI